MRAISVIAVSATLSACVVDRPISQSGTPDSGAPGQPIPDTPNADVPSADARGGDAREQTLATMLGRAQTDRIAGRLQQAESTLETALRIAPNDPRLWLELAEVQFAAGEFESASAIAERAISLSSGNVQIIEASQRIRALSTQR